MSKEVSIVMSTPDVEAIMEGLKTKHCVPIKPQPEMFRSEVIYSIVTYNYDKDSEHLSFCCGNGTNGWRVPKWQPGVTLWVREKYYTRKKGRGPCEYKAGSEEIIKELHEPGGSSDYKWRPPITMPKKYSRIRLKVKNIEARKLSTITRREAIDMGISESPVKDGRSGLWWTISNNLPQELQARNPLKAFKNWWDFSIREKQFHCRHNPWLWVTSFDVESIG